MTAKLEGHTAKVTPAYGMRPVGGFGIRGFRVYCEVCGHLGETLENVRRAQRHARVHRCPQ